MKKRSKIAIALVSSLICLGLVVFGVYAAVVATFELDSSFNFVARGVYVGVSGQVYAGETAETATALTGGNYTLAEQINFTKGADGNPDGTKSNATLPTWHPDNATLDEINPVLIFEITFKNYGPYSIAVTPNNETAGVSGISMTESSNASVIGSGQTGVYRLTLEVTKFLKDIEQKPVNISFTMERTDKEPASSNFTKEPGGKDGYTKYVKNA